MKDIVLIEFSGHAKSVIDSIEEAGQYIIIGIRIWSLIKNIEGM